jgi:hypothetical protein
VSLSVHALHPLNIPIIDEKNKIVVGGSGILQPRTSWTSRPPANPTLPGSLPDRAVLILTAGLLPMFIRICLEKAVLTAKGLSA